MWWAPRTRPTLQSVCGRLIRFHFGSVVNVDHLTVTGASPRTLGLFTIASTINATNSNITVNGAGGSGAAAALNGGTINLTNSTLTLNGAGAGAVRARNQFGVSAYEHLHSVRWINH